MNHSTSPEIKNPLAYTIYCDGKALDGSYQLTYANIRLGLNRIGKATLKLNAGQMDKQTFDEPDSNLFKPGTTIRIDVGKVNKQETLFEGIILEVGIQLGKGTSSQMVLECRDIAYPATQGRKNRIFEKKKDSDIIKEVLTVYGTPKVDATSYPHPELVQYYCTDWDFALSRADACGLFIFTHGREIAVFKPQVDKAPVLTLTYGVDLIDFDASLSENGQYSSYEAVSWNPATQKEVKATAAMPTLNKQGDLSAKELGNAPNADMMQTDAPTDSQALQAWADSQALKAGLSRYQGTFSFYGEVAAVPGCLIELKGLGKRFSGKAFIGAVTHHIENNEWTTQATMGVPVGNITEWPNVVAPSASGWLPGVEGLHTAVVKKLDADPGKEHCIQVELPWMSGPKKELWARLATPYATTGSGYFFLPEPGDEVLVGFVNHDPAHPIVLGALHSSARKPPFEHEAKNNKKAIVTRSGLTMEFDEEKKSVTLHTPAKNLIEMSDEEKSIKLKDQHGNEVTMNADGITLSSAKDLTMKAKGNVSLDAMGKVNISSKSDLAAQGLKVLVEGKTEAIFKGMAKVELSASAQAIVKGAMVMIN
ncbi:MAG: type VI secretion system tip protein VgrG [Mediterranea sp.]|jgi:Rhs element Vgr protein|nr:type VI secretion system tip protein VgrG [Mediterranea sp.]